MLTYRLFRAEHWSHELATTFGIPECFVNKIRHMQQRPLFPDEKRFRQPRGGTCWEPEPLNCKGLSTWISEVPPKGVAHPLFGKRTDNTAISNHHNHN